MGDRFTEVTETGYGQNILASLKGIVFGIILFLASLVVLWWNEGRLDMSQVAEKSVPVSAETVDAAADGAFVSVTGTLTSDQSVGDPQFLRTGPYIMLKRTAEMYAWEENKTTRTKKKLGGGKRRETTYSYSKEWTDRPEDSSSFRKPEGHANPSPSVTSQSFPVARATVGAYRFEPPRADLPHPSFVTVTRENFIPSEEAQLEGSYIFIGQGSLNNPQIGDMRISFSAVRSGMTATLFGTLNGTSIEPYVHKSGKQLYRAITGSREAAIAKMASEHHLVTWLLRGGGFLMMWVGLGLLLGPVNAVLDFVPLFGGLSRALIGLATFVIALCLSITIIVVSMIAHNPVLLIGAVIVVLAAIWGVGRLRSGQKTRAPRPKVSDNAADVREEFDAAESGEEEEAMQIATRGSGPAPAKIRFECDECGKRYSVNSSLAGKKARCKRCGNRVVIPATSAE